MISIARLAGSLPDALGTLVAESEASGVLFVARTAGALVGVCGVNVDPYALDDNVGRVRHLYVARAHRRQHVGRQLVEAVIGASRGRFGALRLRTQDPGAAASTSASAFAP